MGHCVAFLFENIV